MATVTIRNLDDAVVERLRAKARLNDRSLEAELRQALTQLAATPQAAYRLATARRIKALAGEAEFADSTALIREDRER